MEIVNTIWLESNNKLKVNKSNGKVYFYRWDKNENDWKILSAMVEDFSVVITPEKKDIDNGH